MTYEQAKDIIAKEKYNMPYNKLDCGPCIIDTLELAAELYAKEKVLEALAKAERIIDSEKGAGDDYPIIEQ